MELFTPNGDIVSFNIDEVYDENMNKIGTARHPEEIIKLNHGRTKFYNANKNHTRNL